jgi:hypothetical protein
MTISAEQLEQLLELDDLGTNLALAHAIAIVAQDEALSGAQLMRLAEAGERVIASSVVFNRPPALCAALPTCIPTCGPWPAATRMRHRNGSWICSPES